jgi:hypothetical protein
MHSLMKIEKPDDVRVSLTVTMTAKEWEELRGQLSAKWPSSELTYQITNLLAQTRKVLWVQRED